MKTIRSFVRRAGRVSKRQEHAFTNQLKNYELLVDGSPWDLPTVFNREADTVVEIGFGMGASLLAMAENNPQINYLGIEVHQAGIGSLTANLAEQGITNVRIVNHDAVEIFKQQIAANTLNGVQIFFPDPWPKKRHHKRRLIQQGFVELLVNKVKPGGFIHCATDWQEYAEQMLAVFSAQAALVNQNPENGFSLRPANRPLTKFEQRGNRLGHGVWDLIFIKKSA